MRTVGTVSRGVRCPVLKEGDDIIRVVTEAIVAMGEEQKITFHEKDIVAVTEAVVAEWQTRLVQVQVLSPEWGFNSPRRHHLYN